MEGVLRASASSAWAAATTATSAVIEATANAIEERQIYINGDLLDFNNTPVRPPPGIVPELQNPPGAGQAGNIAGLVICVSVTTVLFAVRSYVKFRIRRNYLVEDVTCTIAWVLLIFYASCVFVMISFDKGYKNWEISREDYSQMLKWLYISSLAYAPTAFFTKVTLLLLIARVFTVRTGVSYAIYAFIVILVLAYIPTEITKILICSPIQSYWNPGVDGHCLAQRKIFLADLGVSITTDFVILVVPIPLTWRMRTGWQRKLKIVGMLGAGGSALGVTVYRLVLVLRSTDSHGQASSDFILLDLLQIIEVTIGLCCSCLPAFNILLAHYFSGRVWMLSPREGSGNANRSGTSGSSDQNTYHRRRRRNRRLRKLTQVITLNQFGSLSSPNSDSPRNTTKTTTTTDDNNTTSNTTTTRKSSHRRKPRRDTLAVAPRWETGPTSHMMSKIRRGEEVDEDDEDEMKRREEWLRRRERGRVVDFDVELAMLSSEGRSPGHALPHPPPPIHLGSDSWFVLERATSEDGRREGWLDDTNISNANSASKSVSRRGDKSVSRSVSGTGSGRSRNQPADQQESSREGSSDRQEIEMELAKVTGNKQWEMIFDGRKNT